MAAAPDNHSFTPIMSWTTETTPVLDQHRFDEAALERFMRANVEGFVGPLEIGQVRGGMSNPTFIMSGGDGQRYVLRKKPPGELLPSAHAVDREFRVISALWETDVPVAKPYVSVPGSGCDRSRLSTLWALPMGGFFVNLESA